MLVWKYILLMIMLLTRLFGLHLFGINKLIVKLLLSLNLYSCYSSNSFINLDNREHFWLMRCLLYKNLPFGLRCSLWEYLLSINMRIYLLGLIQYRCLQVQVYLIADINTGALYMVAIVTDWITNCSVCKYVICLNYTDN